MRSIVSTLTLLAAAFVTPVLAHADTFNIVPTTGGSSPQVTLSFTLPASPTPSTTLPPGTFSVTTTVYRNGIADADDILTFYIGASGGGLSDNDSLFQPFGPQLFTGTTAAPTFRIGTFDLSNESVGGHTDYILTISADSPTTATPEPSCLMLLGTGALGLSGVVRRHLRPAFGKSR